MAMSLKEKALKLAIEEMGKQITLEGCKNIWVTWECFHKEQSFIDATWKRKKELEK
jgi:hypothetical protein